MRITRERIKTFILCLLIFIGIMLTGNLWRLEGNRFPFAFNQPKDTETKQLYKAFFIPSRIVVNDGEERHWLIYPSHSREKNDFAMLWEQTVNPLMKAILEQKYPVKYEGDVSAELWEGLIALKNFKIEFKAGLEKELLKLFFDLQKEPSQVFASGMKQIVFSAWESFNERNIVVYIKDVNDKCHKFTVTLSNDEYKKAFNAYMQQLNSASNKPRYLTFGEQKITRVGNNMLVSPEIMIAQGKNLLCLKYPQINFLNEFEGIDVGKVDGASEMAEKLLGEDKDNYRRYIDTSGMVSFIHLNNKRIFRVYPDGFVECFSSRIDAANEKTDIGQAYIAAIDFIYRYGGIPDGIYPFLSKHYYDGKNSYTFEFDYFVEGLPVITSRPYRETDMIKSAIKVIVTGREVEGYLRYIKKPMAGKVNSVNVDTITALNRFVSQNTAIKDTALANVMLAYDASQPEGFPFWFFVYRGDNLYRVDAVKK